MEISNKQVIIIDKYAFQISGGIQSEKMRHTLIFTRFTISKLTVVLVILSHLVKKTTQETLI